MTIGPSSLAPDLLPFSNAPTGDSSPARCRNYRRILSYEEKSLPGRRSGRGKAHVGPVDGARRSSRLSLRCPELCIVLRTDLCHDVTWQSQAIKDLGRKESFLVLRTGEH